jgi:hypothetical protein
MTVDPEKPNRFPSDLIFDNHIKVSTKIHTHESYIRHQPVSWLVPFEHDLSKAKPKYMALCRMDLSDIDDITVLIYGMPEINSLHAKPEFLDIPDADHLQDTRRIIRLEKLKTLTPQERWAVLEYAKGTKK